MCRVQLKSLYEIVIKVLIVLLISNKGFHYFQQKNKDITHLNLKVLGIACAYPVEKNFSIREEYFHWRRNALKESNSPGEEFPQKRMFPFEKSISTKERCFHQRRVLEKSTFTRRMFPLEKDNFYQNVSTREECLYLKNSELLKIFK